LATRATGDEVYGGDPGLRTGLEERQLGYVLAVAKNHTVATAAGSLRVDALAARLPPRAWQRLSAGAGAKGQRWYDWAWVVIEPGRTGYRHLLVRRNRHTRELAFYRCSSRCRAPLATLVKIAGIRWSTEENFQADKGLTGLDEHQVRTGTSWHRWVTLAMLALAFLTVAALTGHAQPPPPGMIPLTATRSPTSPPPCCPRPGAAGVTGPAGPAGAAATSTPPGLATTGGKPPTAHDGHDRQAQSRPARAQAAGPLSRPTASDRYCTHG
jgi:hypothetical protein